MATRLLAPELISLVHHVALNESGWWKKSVRRMITAAVWMAGRPLTTPEIVDSLNEQTGIPLDASEVSAHVSALCSEKILLGCGTEPATVKVAETYIREFESDVADSKANEHA